MQTLDKQQVLQKLTAICAQGEHCIHEMREKMNRWEVDEDIQVSIIEYLVNEHFINEERYCRAYIHDKMEYNGWGRKKIEQGLWLKHIPKDISNSAFEEIDDELWVEKLRPLIAQKRKSTKGRNEYEINQKLIRFACQRGFSISEAIKCVGDCDEMEF